MAHTHSVKEYPGQMMGIAILAAGAGALAGILYAPKRGAEMRKDMMVRMKNIRIKASKLPKAEKKLAKDGAQRAKSTAKAASARTRTTAHKIKSDTKTTAREVKRDAKGNIAKAKDMTDHIRRNGEP